MRTCKGLRGWMHCTVEDLDSKKYSMHSVVTGQRNLISRWVTSCDIPVAVENCLAVRRESRRLTWSGEATSSTWTGRSLFIVRFRFRCWCVVQIVWHTKVVQWSCNHAGATGSVLSPLELRLVSRSRSCLWQFRIWELHRWRQPG